MSWSTLGSAFGLATHQDLSALVTSVGLVGVNSVVDIGEGVVGVTSDIEIRTWSTVWIKRKFFNHYTSVTFNNPNILIQMEINMRKNSINHEDLVVYNYIVGWIFSLNK